MKERFRGGEGGRRGDTCNHGSFRRWEQRRGQVTKNTKRTTTLAEVSMERKPERCDCTVTQKNKIHYAFMSSDTSMFSNPVLVALNVKARTGGNGTTPVATACQMERKNKTGRKLAKEN